MLELSGHPASDAYLSDPGVADHGLEISFAVDGRHLIVSLAGEIDVANADLLPAVVAGALKGDDSVRIDIAEVTFLDSSLLRALVVCQANLQAAGIDVRVRNPSPQALRVFELTSLTSLVE